VVVCRPDCSNLGTWIIQSICKDLVENDMATGSRPRSIFGPNCPPPASQCHGLLEFRHDDGPDLEVITSQCRFSERQIAGALMLRVAALPDAELELAHAQAVAK
jgi:hypothetical protein